MIPPGKWGYNIASSFKGRFSGARGKKWAVQKTATLAISRAGPAWKAQSKDTPSYTSKSRTLPRRCPLHCSSSWWGYTMAHAYIKSKFEVSTLYPKGHHGARCQPVPSINLGCIWTSDPEVKGPCPIISLQRHVIPSKQQVPDRHFQKGISNYESFTNHLTICPLHNVFSANSSLYTGNK